MPDDEQQASDPYNNDTSNNNDDYSSSSHNIPVTIVPQSESFTPPPASQPAFMPPPTPAVVAEAPQQKSSAGILVLQWLVYAFWGWTALALAWLTSVSVGHFVDGANSADSYGDSMVAYALAAVLVLFIISILCDVFYARHEPQHKTGAAMIIAIIHAVIFALCGIGSLIAAVFAVVQMLVGETSYDGSSSGAKTLLISSFIISLVYGATLLRTLHPGWFKKVTVVYWSFMTAIVVAIMALAVFGPIAQTRLMRDDRAIEGGLTGVSRAIADYSKINTKLPSSLSNVKSSLTGEASDIVSRNLVEYTPGGIVVSQSSSSIYTDQKARLYSKPAYEYKLCVTYKAKKGSTYGGATDMSYRTSRSTTPDTYYHAAGRVCYDLQTEYTY